MKILYFDVFDTGKRYVYKIRSVDEIYISQVIKRKCLLKRHRLNIQVKWFLYSVCYTFWYFYITAAKISTHSFETWNFNRNLLLRDTPRCRLKTQAILIFLMDTIEMDYIRKIFQHEYLITSNIQRKCSSKPKIVKFIYFQTWVLIFKYW